MKRGPEYSDSSRKKLVGELLRNADKLLKTGEYDQALGEVEKSLELEPGNFYAQAYKERISALRDKHGKPGERSSPAPASRPAGGSGGLTAGEPSPGHPAPLTELTEATGARIEEVAGIETSGGVTTTSGEGAVQPPVEEEPAGRDIAGLKEQLERERASHEDETRRQAEEMAREALETELRQHTESDRLRAAEQQATQEALAGAHAEALAEVVTRSAATFARLLASGDLDGAERDLAVIGIVDPDNAELGAMTAKLDAARVAAMTRAAAEPRTLPREITLQWYGKLIRAAWSEGTPNRNQSEAVAEAKRRFKVTPEEEKTLLAAIKREIVTDALTEAYRDGAPDVETKAFLETLARQLSVGDLETLRASAGA